MNQHSSKLQKSLSSLHIIYLCFLPAAATYALVRQYGPFPEWGNMLIFFGGIGAVGVYLAVTVSYTPRPKKLSHALLLLFDAPLFIFLSFASTRHFSFSFSFALDSYLIDGLATWLAISYLSLGTRDGSKRPISLALMLFAIIVTSYLFFPYIKTELWGEWLKLFWLALGLFEAVTLRHYLLKNEQMADHSEDTAAYIVFFIVVWLASFIIANVSVGG